MMMTQRYNTMSFEAQFEQKWLAENAGKYLPVISVDTDLKGLLTRYEKRRDMELKNRHVIPPRFKKIHRAIDRRKPS
jgi:hypothetical protein